MPRRILAAAVGTLACALVLSTGARADPRGPAGGAVRLNQLQVIGTHNSYHREISEREQAAYDAAINTPGDYDAFLAYSHATLPRQFARQNVRGLELDLFGDPAGGLYAEPLVRRAVGLGPLADPAWRAPGIKVLHIADVDYRTTCVQLVTCLRQVRAWSQAHPQHVPIPIMLELKRSDARIVNVGGVVAPAWDAAALDALDAEIRSVFDEDEMITPDDVRRRGHTLEGSVLEHGWPRLRDARGKVMFLLDNDPGAIRDAYLAGRPNLEGRVLFTNARPGFSDAAFVKRNEPRGANTAQIADLVRRGYYVRTRSDVPLQTVITNDNSMLYAALASGAQLSSTDFPQIGMSARYDSDFVAELPNGEPVRCNPVNAPPALRRRAAGAAAVTPPRAVVVAVLALAFAAGSPAAAAGGGLPLGASHLDETRTSRAVAPGVVHTRIVRGAPDPRDGWAIDVAIVQTRSDARTTVARLRALGHRARVQRIGPRAQDDPQRGPWACASASKASARRPMPTPCVGSS